MHIIKNQQWNNNLETRNSYWIYKNVRLYNYSGKTDVALIKLIFSLHPLPDFVITKIPTTNVCINVEFTAMQMLVQLLK